MGWNRIVQAAVWAGFAAALAEAGDVSSDLVVDNTGSDFEIVVGRGAWKKCTHASGIEGADCLVGKAAATKCDELVRWKLQIPREGRYRVFARCPSLAEAKPATNAPFLVLHRDGQSLARVDQARSPEGWRDLGVYAFSLGSKAQVTLGTNADGPVIADAVRLAYEGPVGPTAKPSGTFLQECQAKGRVVFADDFSGGLENWVFEGPAETAVRDGKLHIKSIPMPGHMAWIRKPHPAAFRLEYDVIPLSPSGFWLVFFCNSMPKNADMFALELPGREGDFDKYVHNTNLSGYHISYRRNTSATCNLRKNPGLVLLKQQDLDGVLEVRKTFHVTLVYERGRVELKVDGRALMEFQDAAPVYGSGHIALRNVYDCETEYDNVAVYDLTGK